MRGAGGAGQRGTRLSRAPAQSRAVSIAQSGQPRRAGFPALRPLKAPPLAPPRSTPLGLRSFAPDSRSAANPGAQPFPGPSRVAGRPVGWVSGDIASPAEQPLQWRGGCGPGCGTRDVGRDAQVPRCQKGSDLRGAGLSAVSTLYCAADSLERVRGWGTDPDPSEGETGPTLSSAACARGDWPPSARCPPGRVEPAPRALSPDLCLGPRTHVTCTAGPAARVPPPPPPPSQRQTHVLPRGS